MSHPVVWGVQLPGPVLGLDQSGGIVGTHVDGNERIYIACDYAPQVYHLRRDELCDSVCLKNGVLGEKFEWREVEITVTSGAKT